MGKLKFWWYGHFKNRLAVAGRKSAITVSKTQQVQFTQSKFFTNKTVSNPILFTCFAKLKMEWNYFIDRWKTSTSVETSSNNFLNPKLSFPLFQFTQSKFFTNKTVSNLILFTCFVKLPTEWNYFIDRWKTSTSVETSSNNFLNPKLSFPLRKPHVPTQFTLFLHQ